MIISFSEILRFQVCIRSYYYSSILNLSPINQSDSIDTGIKGHKLLQKFFELIKIGTPKADALKEVQILAGQDPDFNMLKAWILVENYVNSVDFSDTILHVENQFKIPANTFFSNEFADFGIDFDWTIGFTPDVVFERKGKKVDVEDFKFVQRMWPQAKINRFPQVRLYRILLTHLGYDVSRSILRMFNVDTGKTKYQIYSPSSTENSILMRDFLYAATKLKEFKEKPSSVHKDAPRTMNYFTCLYCAYENPCSLEAQGKSVTNTLKYNYRTTNYGYN